MVTGALHGFRHVPISLVLLVLVRQGIAPQEQEFATEQADPGRPGLAHVLHVLRQLDIGQQFDRGAVLGLGVGLADRRQLATGVAPGAQSPPILGQHQIVRIDDHHALQAIDDDQLVFADQLARMVQRDYRRQVQAAAQDSGMRGGAADIGDEGGEVRVFEINHVGRRQVVRHQDMVVD